MKISLNWLHDYLDGTVEAKELAERLTARGLEVEGIEERGLGLEGIVVAEIRAARPHPNAAALQLCTIFDGTTELELVCGAKNTRPGILVPYAREGALLPGGIRLGAKVIRGVESRGMLCSEKELGLSEEASGLWELPAGTAPGQDVAALVRDTVLVLGITPNRPDCLSHIGIAREAASCFGQKLRLPESPLQEGSEAIDFKISLEDPEGCPRYAARIVRGVKIAPSPLWMQLRLSAVGVRAISNVVDVTNYVMMEYGQPLHAFDLPLLAGQTIRIRRAHEGESMKTLDGASRSLLPSDLLIADAEKGVALAGVMGGASSEVSDTTQDVLLESAYFEPSGIRRTARRQGLHTESSHRFERGADPEVVPIAQDRALSLVQQLAGGVVLQGRVDLYPTPIARKVLTLRPARIREILGVDAPMSPLSSIGLVEKGLQGEATLWEVPTNRPDIVREIDLIEEVARLYGIDAIPARMPRLAVVEKPAAELLSPVDALRVLRHTARTMGFSEAISYGFCAKADIEKLGFTDARGKTVALKNPIAADLDVMRSTLAVGLLNSLSRNTRRQQGLVRLFEIGKVFSAGSDRPVEELRFAAIGWGTEEAWFGRQELDFFAMKGLAEELVASLGLQLPGCEVAEASYFLPSAAAVLRCQDREIGTVGELHPDVLERFEIPGRAFLLDLSLSEICALAVPVPRFQEISRFPAVTRDAALLLDMGVSWQRVEAEIVALEIPILQRVRLFDVYQGKGVPEGQRSLAISLSYQSASRTLTDEEVQRAQESVLARLSESVGAKAR
jgi:phenylalanyl-tRNA synthetase beta chain